MRARRVAIAGLSALVVRAVIACGDDANDTPPLLTNEDGGSVRGDGGDPGPREDGAAGDGDVGPPSFCSGIMFYVPFDGTLRPKLGASALREGGLDARDGGAPMEAGLFGGAVSLVTSGSTIPAVFYDRSDGGDAGPPALVYSEREGTVAYWYKRTGELPAAYAAHVRPYNGAGFAAGLVIAKTNDDFGLWDDLGGDAVLVFRTSELAPFLRDTAFDHFAATWRKEDDDAGTKPLARLVVNGGLGEIVGAGDGLDAAAHADAKPDDAGNLSTPYRAQTTNPFFVSGAFTTLRVGGVPGTAPQGSFDDLAVWNRMLSFDELAALYASGASIGTICKL